ncbi:hypothetical protein OTU49_007666 [Cherax quadricarinatus]|uniref:Cyclin-dependent kinase inhibitor domain-containing protein n=2 Tax=Cherax quadricarinatus TaxID=27406 RepID=A0AAW0WTS7_CHEQU
MFFKKTSARRALSELGVNDSKANLRMAEALFTITAEHFMKKWNFDPVRCRPLPSGRYQWTPAKPVKKHRLSQASQKEIPQETSLGDLSTSACQDTADVCRFLGQPDEESRFQGDNFEDVREIEYATALPTVHQLPLTPRKTHRRKEPHTPKTLQCKITDYGRQRKRLHSCSKSEDQVESDPITPRKKLALSPSTPSK